MNVNELCAEIEKAGGKVKPIKKHCKFQTVFAENIFEYCKQTRNPDYSFNLGSAGGPTICCEGAFAKVIRWESTPNRGGASAYKPVFAEEPEPCPNYIEDGEVIGYKIILPVGRINKSKRK